VRGLHSPFNQDLWGPGLGFRLEGSGYDGRRSRALAHSALTGGVMRKSSGWQVKLGTPSARSVFRVAHRAAKEADSGVPGSDNGASEVGTVR